MTIAPAICIDCQAGNHRHSGVCRSPAEIEIPTSAGRLTKSAACTCRRSGTSNADTQTEVAFHG